MLWVTLWRHLDTTHIAILYHLLSVIWVNLNQPGPIRPSRLAASIPITPSHVTSCEEFAGLVPDLLSEGVGKGAATDAMRLKKD